jgi:myo-inositol-1(or 4)-monophosphatase
MTPEEISSAHDFVRTLVRTAGDMARSAFGSTRIEYKESGVPFDVCTEADRSIDAFLKQEIRAKYPNHSIRSEEGDAATTSSRVWSIDPIDGSSNFSRSIPHFAVSVCLLVEGVPTLGAVYNPMTDELYSFIRGEGSFLNGTRIRASTTGSLAGSTVLLTIGSREINRKWGLELYERLFEAEARVRNFGSSGLDICYLAAGRVDAVIYGGIGLLDVAAAVGIALEAGCTIMHADDGSPLTLTHAPARMIASCSPELGQAIRSL